VKYQAGQRHRAGTTGVVVLGLQYQKLSRDSGSQEYASARFIRPFIVIVTCRMHHLITAKSAV
jgi:hypothetical protein